MKRQHEFATRAIHAGQEPDPSTGAVMTPIYATSTYVQESPGKHKGYDYARSINPTRLAYERCIANLESGIRGFAFASGLAAMSTVLEVLESGSHIVASDDLYGGTFRLFDKVRRRSANLDFTYADLTDAKDLERAIKPNTRMVWIETPSNPLLKLIDLKAITKIARKRKIISVCDNTFATPWIQRPIESGFDIVVHSATKYLNGHSDLVGGVAVVGDKKEIADQIAFLQNSVGGIVTIVLKGDLADTRRFLENTHLFALAESLGGVESLINHPALMTHASVPEEKREKLGVTNSLVRLSVGIEDVRDLIDDLKFALEAI